MLTEKVVLEDAQTGDDMNKWHLILQEAQLLNESGKTELALEAYKHSVRLAEKMFSGKDNIDYLTRVLTLSYHALGDIFFKTNKVRQGLECYQQLITRLKSANAYEQNSARRLSLKNAEQRAYASLVAISKQVTSANSNQRENA